MIRGMSEHGGGADMTPQHSIPRSRLADYAEMADVPPVTATKPTAEPSTENAHGAQDGSPAPEPAANPATETPEAPEAAARRRHFAAVLGEFRRAAVLVPLGDAPGPDGERGLLTADFNGVRFILAFSDEQALARYAQARGEYAREWTYQKVLTRGGPVQAAGEAEIAGGDGSYFGMEINNNSGHYRPSLESLQVGRDAFERAGIIFLE